MLKSSSKSNVRLVKLGKNKSKHLKLLTNSETYVNKIKDRDFSYKLESQTCQESFLTKKKINLKRTKTKKRKLIETMEKFSSSSIASSSSSSLLKRQIAHTNLTIENLNTENNLNSTSTSLETDAALVSSASLMCSTCLENMQQCLTCLSCDCQEQTTSTALTQYSFLFADDNQANLLSSTPNHIDRNINRFKLPSFKYTTSDKKISKLVKNCYFLKTKSDKSKFKINTNLKKEMQPKKKNNKNKKDGVNKIYSVRSNNKRAKYVLPRTSSSNDLLLRLNKNKKTVVDQNQLPNNLIYQGSFYSNNIYSSSENNFKNFGDFLVWYV